MPSDIDQLHTWIVVLSVFAVLELGELLVRPLQIALGQLAKVLLVGDVVALADWECDAHRVEL